MSCLPVWQARCLVGAGVAGLAMLAMISVQPAPSIRVRWRDDVSTQQQSELERKYHLADPAAPLPDVPRSIAYRLLDTSRTNIEALVVDPRVADTHDIDRTHFEPVVVYRGVGREWLAAFRRTVRLRDGRVQLVAFLVFAVMAAAGVRRLRAERGRRRPGDTRPTENEHDSDLFDAVGARHPCLAAARVNPATDRWTAARRLIAVALLIAATGPPITATWEAKLLGVALLTVIFSAGALTWRRVMAAVVAVVLIVAVKALLPRADIAEAHNAFVVSRDGNALERGLPAQIYQSWKAQFDALYPPSPGPYPPFSWRGRHAETKALFTASADALWRQPKYTRQVDDIAFHSLAEFRGGFANELDYNFWTGELSRERLPFYVMYELTPATIGSSLSWTGQVFWERRGGEFDEIRHDAPAARTITERDAGMRVFAAFFPQRNPALHVQLRRSWPLRAAAVTGAILTVAGVLIVLATLARPRWPACLRAVALFAAGSLMIAWVEAGAFLGRNYPPHRGSDDGLLHDGYGHMMAILAARGEIVKSLEGAEPVYWFTPGTRYVRLIEKLLFGDTNHLFGLMLACMPLVMFYLARYFLGTRRAWILTAVFCILPVGSPSFLQYVANARLGYGDSIGGALFLLGLVITLRTYADATGARRTLAGISLAGAALATSMFIRPNFALAVVWVGAAYAWTALRRRDTAGLIAFAGALGLALWMPFHNWYYGGELYLISRAGATISMPLGTGDYIGALASLARGDVNSPPVAAISKQITGWLSGPGFMYREWLEPAAWLLHAVKIAALPVALWIVLRWVMSGFSRGAALAVLAIASFCAQAPMLFVFKTAARYAMLGWDLTVLALVVYVWSGAVPVNANEVSHGRPAALAR